MNSRKKLTVLGITFFLFLMQYLSFAQTFKFTSGMTGAFNITLPSLNPNQDNPRPFYTLFIETGDGRYINNPNNKIYDYNVSSPQNISYSNFIAANSNALLNIVTHYDTTPPPLRLISRPGISNSTGSLTAQTNLPFGKKVAFDYSDRVVVPGDTMTTVITYKTDAITKPTDTSNKYIVAFFYNHKFKGGKVFSEITDANSKLSFNGDSVKAIRLPENVTAFTNIDNIPGTGSTDGNIREQLRIAKGYYYNAIYFLIKNGKTVEKNIFISLAPDKLTTLNYVNGMATNIDAIKIKYNDNTVFLPEKIYDSLKIRLDARDPNGIESSPECLEELVLNNPYNLKISNVIEFVNDGKGTAKNVRVTVTVPPGVQFPQQFISAYRKVNGTTIPFWPNTKNYFKLNPVKRTITFYMNEINLVGTATPGNTLNQRRGTISFNLKTNGAGMVIPNCMYFYVSIVFVNSDGPENPPFTAFDVVQKYCMVADFDCPIPINSF